MGDNAPADWHAWLAGANVDLEQRNLLRILRPTCTTASSVEAQVSEADLQAWLAGREPPPASQLESAAAAGSLHTVKLFSLNDYLGLSNHPDVRRAAAEAAEQVGMGPRSSALVGGYTSLHRRLEQELARLKGTQDCLLFPTGFAANMAVMAALGSDPDTVIFSDELNHASIIDGARLAVRGGSRLQVYRHNDMVHLEQLLCSCLPGRRKLVVTDSLFSMDGDFADLRALARLRRRHAFLLVVDEAHATLVCGERGGGAAEMLGVSDCVDLHVGTLSKAAGALGGFVACSRAFKTYLSNKGRSIVYSTALPLPVVAAALAALEVSHREAWRRRHLARLVAKLGAALGVPAHSPVVPLVVGSEQAAVALSSRLLRRGFHVPAIRPPTVPAGTCRLRVSLSAAHSEADVEELVQAVQGSGAVLQPLEHLLAAEQVYARHLEAGKQHLHQQHQQHQGQAQQPQRLLSKL